MALWITPLMRALIRATGVSTMSPNTVSHVSGLYRQRGEGGAQRVSVGRVRGTRSLGAERLAKMRAVSLRGAAKKEITGTPLTLPLLRNGPLPLPASRARGVWAVLGRDVADQRCVNPIVAKAGTHRCPGTGLAQPVMRGD